MKTIAKPVSSESSAARHLWREQHVFVNPASPVVILRQAQGDSAAHRHAFTELVFVTAGIGFHDVDGIENEVEAGDFFVMEGARSHAYRKTKRLEIINVLIRDRVMSGLRPMLEKLHGYDRMFAGTGAEGNPFSKPRRLLPHEFNECTGLIERMEREAETRADGCYDMQTALILELMIVMLRFATGQPEGVADIRTRIGKTIRHLEQKYAGEIDLAYLERMACMSPRSLQRHFLDATGATPMQYLKRIRMAHACRLLRETELPVTEVGGLCGIQDSAYFCRLFSQSTGKSPSVYRRLSAQHEK